MEDDGTVERTRLGCTVTRDFLLSTNGEDSTLMYDLMDKGFKELYYTAPYNWGLLNPQKKRIITYVEGDIDKIDCETDELLIEEAESHINFIKKNYGNRVIWAEGEELVKKLRNPK